MTESEIKKTDGCEEAEAGAPASEGAPAAPAASPAPADGAGAAPAPEEDSAVTKSISEMIREKRGPCAAPAGMMAPNPRTIAKSANVYGWPTVSIGAGRDATGYLAGYDVAPAKGKVEGATVKPVRKTEEMSISDMIEMRRNPSHFAKAEDVPDDEPPADDAPADLPPMGDAPADDAPADLPPMDDASADLPPEAAPEAAPDPTDPSSVAKFLEAIPTDVLSKALDIMEGIDGGAPEAEPGAEPPADLPPTDGAPADLPPAGPDAGAPALPPKDKAGPVA